MAMDPFFENLLAQSASNERPPESDPEQSRENYRAYHSLLPPVEVAEVSNTHFSAGDREVPVRIYSDDPDSTLPGLLYFHGGGWTIGDLETHDSICRQLAKAAPCRVVAVDYRRAPEDPYPAAFDDCYDALIWVADNAPAMKINSDKLVVAGDSAGGNLAACVSLKSRDAAGPALCAQLLIYPVTDNNLDNEAYRQNGVGKLLSRDTMTNFLTNYLGEGFAGCDDPYALPAKASDLSRLPAACVITAEHDPLYAEGEAYAARLAAAGVETTVKRFPGMLHTFYGMTNLMQGAQDAMAMSTRFLNQVFAD